MKLVGDQHIQGKVRAHRVENEIWTPQTELKSNLVLYQWSAIIGQLLSNGDARYRIGGMLLEFENVASPGDAVSIPTFDRTRDITYYDDLVGSGVRDYIRVAMTANTLTNNATNSELTFFARSVGTTGVHGKTFSDSVNSKIFGASLVSFIDSSDATQDLILSSYYFDVADQQLKLATSQVGIEWRLQLQ